MKKDQDILLAEIADGLAAIQKHLERRIPLGYTLSITVSVTDVPVEVNLGEWVDAILRNDGANDVYIYGVRQTADTRDAALKTGETLNIGRVERTKDKLYLVCVSGETATVRIFHQ